MSDKNKSDKSKQHPEDEYQYPREEFVPEPPESEQPATTPSGRFESVKKIIRNNPRVSLVVGVVLVILIVSKIFHRSNVPAAAKVVPVTAAMVTSPAPVVIPLAVKDELSSLKSAAQAQQAQSNDLQNQMESLRNQLDKIQAAQDETNQAAQQLGQQLKDLIKTVQPLVAKPSASKGPATKPMVFHLKAVIPGRAWIVSEDGFSESVTVGDSIPQYGIVEQVNADRGMVLTNSGKVIEYGLNDR